jgi:hypothetical protein
MIEVSPFVTDQFGFSLGNSTDPEVVIMPVRAFAEMQAASQSEFAAAAMTYMVAALVIGFLVGALVVWVIMRQRIIERDQLIRDLDDPGDDDQDPVPGAG